MSDVDLNLVYDDPGLSERTFTDEELWDFTSAIHQFSHELGIRIEVSSHTTDNRTASRPFFSYREQRFYGKNWGQRLNCHYLWDKDLHTWVKGEKSTPSVRWEGESCLPSSSRPLLKTEM